VRLADIQRGCGNCLTGLDLFCFYSEARRLVFRFWLGIPHLFGEVLFIIMNVDRDQAAPHGASSKYHGALLFTSS